MDKKRLRNKADRLIQEAGRKKYNSCLVCGKEMACLHHYVPKSICSALRYDFDNLVPLCHGCHMKHHNGNPDIHNTVNKNWGDEWLNRLNQKKNMIVKTNEKFYKDVIERLNDLE